MSAEVLRKAARLMRERGERAGREQSPDPIRGWYAHTTADGRAWVSNEFGKWLSMHGYPNGAEHVASWHPALALAVADWLDYQAVTYAANKVAWDDGFKNPANRWVERGLTVEANLEFHHGHALAVARAYLGDPA